MLSAPRTLLVLALLAAATAAQARPDPSLDSVPWNGERALSGVLLVQFREGTSPAQQSARHAELGATEQDTIADGLVRVALPAGAELETLRAQYAAAPEVEFAEPDVLQRPAGTPDDPKWPQQWNLIKVRADVAWSTYAGDPSAVVAIIDSGVDLDHPDLEEHFAWGSDPWAGDADPTDTDGHGTHCAGIAAAVTDNGVGVAGAAPGCRFAAYRCGTSSFPTSALVLAIDDAVARGARVLSMSWGSSYDDPAIRNALKAAAAQGCVLVAAAGNDDSTAAFYPAAHPFVIAVGASTSTDARAAFSNFGSWVDLAAPGQSILSTYKDGQYKLLSGTSMACPLVAGAATLLYARLGERSAAHAAKVRAALEGSGVPIGSWVAHGRLDMAAAMSLLFPPGPPQVVAFGPTELPALHGTQLTVTGLDLLGTTSVTLGGQPASFQALSDSTLHVQSPDAPSLGPAAMVVTTPLGTTSLDFNWVATSPPQLLAAATASAGAPFTWSFGGAPGETSFLLLSLQPDTITWNDATLLAVPALIVGGQLNAVGLGGLSLVLPAGSAGLSFRSQLATWNGSLTGVTPVATTTIQ